MDHSHSSGTQRDTSMIIRGMYGGYDVVVFVQAVIDSIHLTHTWTFPVCFVIQHSECRMSAHAPCHAIWQERSSCTPAR